MASITKEELAARLTCREYRSETTPQDRADAKAAGLVIVFGASDDLIEMEGAIEAEGDCYEGGTFYFDAMGLLDRGQIDDDDDDEIAAFVSRKTEARRIEARWCWGDAEWPWTYSTDIPHATFDIMEDGDPYCRGIVFSIEDLG
jgi:hypothetical protein